jgi:hypothetical protein
MTVIDRFVEVTLSPVTPTLYVNAKVCEPVVVVTTVTVLAWTCAGVPPALDAWTINADVSAGTAPSIVKLTKPTSLVVAGAWRAVTITR